MSAPETLLACCSDGECGGGGECVGAPSACPDDGEGVCVNDYETCSGTGHSSSCGGGECCVNQLCQSCSGGGGGNCQNPSAWGIDCPAGTVKGSTVVGSVCASSSFCPGLGSAQSMGACCDWVQPPRECSDWYPCPTFNNPNKMCRDCTQEDPWCRSGTVNTYNCVSVCSATAPTGISATRTSATSATVDWTPGTGGTTQRIYIGANEAEVEANCPGISSPACVVSNTSLTSSQSSYSTGNVLVAGSTYYIRVVNYEDSSCSSNSATSNYMSSCTISPSTQSVTLNETATLTTSVNSSGEITEVTYSSSNPSSVGVTSPDSSYVYTSTVSGDAIGSSTITSEVYFGAVLACSDTATVTTVNPDPWWQVIDSDISAQGDLSSGVPSGEFFGLEGPGGYSGIPSYSGSTDLTSADVNSLGWIAQSSSVGSKVYDYNFFASQIPSDVVFNSINAGDAADSLNTPGSSFYGYEWYKYVGPGNLNIDSDVNFGSRKVVLLIENGNLFINDNINLTDGEGFFMAAVDGNTSVDSTLGGSLPDLEGIYLSDGTFSTGAGATQLYIRGLVAAYGGVSLQRDFADATNQTTPAEVFEYAADQVLLFPSKISLRKINWKEVAP